MISSQFNNDPRSLFTNCSVSVIFLLFVFTSISTAAPSLPKNSNLTITHSHGELNDCPNLEADFGDPCDDGNAATENDVVTIECVCTGTYPTPANDLIENAQVLPDMGLLQCGEIFGTTLGANNELGAFECDPLSSTAPDVFYMFNSGDYLYNGLYIDLTTQADLIISVTEAGEDGELIDCHVGNEPPSFLSKNTDYIIRIAPASGFEGAGEFSICFSPSHLCDLVGGGDPGDPCLTWYFQPGILDSYCDCVTPVGNCYADYNGGTVSLPNTREIWNGQDNFSTFYTFTDLIDGAQYSFECPYLVTWVTIRANNQIQHEGWAPVTYTSDGTDIRVDFNGNSDCWNSAGFSTYVDVQCVTCNDCPDLEANFGDPCDDGNAATEDDLVTSECVCAGTYPTPANDLIENAQVLPNIETINCNGGEVNGTTLGANNELGAFECDPLNDTVPDVYYTFNSGDYIYTGLEVNLITQADLIISVSESGEDGELITCFTEYEEFLLSKNTDYIIRIAPVSGLEGSGEFSICFSPFHLCPGWGDKDPGDPCYTWGNAPGFLDNTCECVPTVGNCSTIFNGGTINLTNTNTIISTSVSADSHIFFTNATNGSQYTFTARGGFPGNWGPPGYITVRGAGGIIGEGYSPVTVTSNLDGTLSADYTLTNTCETDGGTLYYATVQCISCDFQCPDLEANFGDPCDDGNPNTINDEIDTDCNCTGEAQTGSLSLEVNWDSNCNERELNVNLYAPGDNTMLYSFATLLNTNGDIVIDDGIPIGNYDIYVKIDGHLAKGFYNESITTGNNLVLVGSPKAGDLNNDNMVNILDLTALNMSYGLSESDSNFNYLADLNCDGGVNIIDVSTQMIAFGEVGAQP